MSVPGIGPLTVLAYVNTVEDPARFGNSRAVGAHLGLEHRAIILQRIVLP